MPKVAAHSTSRAVHASELCSGHHVVRAALNGEKTADLRRRRAAAGPPSIQGFHRGASGKLALDLLPQGLELLAPRPRGRGSPAAQAGAGAPPVHGAENHQMSALESTRPGSSPGPTMTAASTSAISAATRLGWRVTEAAPRGGPGLGGHAHGMSAGRDTPAAIG